MSTLDYDFKYLQTGLDELKDYLFADELFWPLSLGMVTGGSTTPKLTPGNLLLTLKDLQGRDTSGELTSTEKALLAKLESRLETMKVKWQVAWEERLAWEFKSRLRQWNYYVNEVAKKVEKNIPYYASEIRPRVLLEVLLGELGEEEREEVEPFDQVLRGFFKAGDFVWDEELKPVYPQDVYWFLYGELFNLFAEK